MVSYLIILLFFKTASRTSGSVKKARSRVPRPVNMVELRAHDKTITQNRINETREPAIYFTCDKQQH
jgi:hypothetical protein